MQTFSVGLAPNHSVPNLYTNATAYVVHGRPDDRDPIAYIIKASGGVLPVWSPNHSGICIPITRFGSTHASWLGVSQPMLVSNAGPIPVRIMNVLLDSTYTSWVGYQNATPVGTTVPDPNKSTIITSNKPQTGLLPQRNCIRNWYVYFLSHIKPPIQFFYETPRFLCIRWKSCPIGALLNTLIILCAWWFTTTVCQRLPVRGFTRICRGATRTSQWQPPPFLSLRIRDGPMSDHENALDHESHISIGKENWATMLLLIRR